MNTPFMKDFMDGEKSPEEKAMMAAEAAERKHDVMMIDADAYTDEEAEEEDIMGCDLPAGGCGGCGCRS
ncbi:MAG: hypothetical protein RBS08_02190 [Bdellovibrionales bacterium]|jgi:hypothetical protein|nr:hypothetical protein [Bdellovibrionales bacterium]